MGKPRWKPNEYKKLLKLISKHGTKDFKVISRAMGNKSEALCRDRWRIHEKVEKRKEMQKIIQECTHKINTSRRNQNIKPGTEKLHLLADVLLFLNGEL